MFEHELKNAYIGEYWSPNANTIAYFPFENDTADHSGNGWTLNAPSITKSGIGYRATGGVATNQNSSNVKTWSIWFNVVSGSSPYIHIGGPGILGAGYYYKHAESRLNQKLFCWTSSSRAISAVPLSVGTGAWHNLIFTYDSTSSNLYGYFDGTQYLIYNGTPYSFGNDVSIMGSQANSSSDDFSGNLICDLSDFIIEDKTRTAQEVLDYYNKTKSTYGL